jgi:glucosamine kinase
VLFAGIDGGQSSTRAVIGDGARILAHGRGGPADELGAKRESTRMRDALAAALADAVRTAGLPEQTRFEAIVAGVSGYEGTIYGQPPQLPAERFELMHDAPIAHAGALYGEPGVLVIAGTGSVAYTLRADGRRQTFGGWGYLFGDEGSAFWIVRTLVSHAAAHESCSCARRLVSYFEAKSLREVARSFYAGDIGRDRFASFAAVALGAANEADACPALRETVRDAAEAIARLACSAVLEPCKIAFTGGLLQDAWFEGNVHASVRALVPECTVVMPAAGAAEGALLLASRL